MSPQTRWVHSYLPGRTLGPLPICPIALCESGAEPFSCSDGIKVAVRLERGLRTNEFVRLRDFKP